MTHVSRSSNFWILARTVLAGVCLLTAGASAMAQTTRKTAEESPVFLDYRGVQIGWLAACGIRMSNLVLRCVRSRG